MTGNQRPPHQETVRINAFDYFRAVAILVIVAGHTFPPWDIDTVAERALANLIAGGTSLFVFISGFFLHSHFHGRTGPAAFVAGKLRTVIAPYVLMATAGFIVQGYVLGAFPHVDALVPPPPGPLHDVWLWGDYLLTGRIFVAYWYIPFIAILFALTRQFYAYIDLSPTTRWTVMAVWFLAAMVIQRSALDLSPLHAALYFVPIYMAGINYSMHRTGIDRFIRAKTVPLGALAVVLALTQALTTTELGNLEKPTLLAYNGIDISTVQKMALCLFCVAVLNRFETARLPVLKLLASASFAIFFIHPWVILALNPKGLAGFYLFLPGIAVWLVNFALATAISLALAVILKRLLGSRSRYVIGW